MSEQSTDKLTNQLRIDEVSFFHLYDAIGKSYISWDINLGDAYRAEGVVQEVFTSIWQRKDSLVLSEDTIENYLVRAVRFRISRIYNDEIRKAKKMDELLQRQPIAIIIIRSRKYFTAFKRGY